LLPLGAAAVCQAKGKSDFLRLEGRRCVTIIEINAEATPLTAEGVSDYLIQGRTAEILPLIAIG